MIFRLCIHVIIFRLCATPLPSDFQGFPALCCCNPYAPPSVSMLKFSSLSNSTFLSSVPQLKSFSLCPGVWALSHQTHKSLSLCMFWESAVSRDSINGISKQLQLFRLQKLLFERHRLATSIVITVKDFALWVNKVQNIFRDFKQDIFIS